ncbi:MAG: glycosyltransferase family 1 protein, partial [Candidatus Levybacteria bacterium]|nr:glycosyltransferase family 1 protein [Candidatus Levybacteria bacterium]
ALYFNPYDIDEIVERMRNVCFNDLNHFSKNIEKGLERARRFSWEKMARETLTVYASCSSAGSG